MYQAADVAQLAFAVEELERVVPPHGDGLGHSAQQLLRRFRV